MNSASTVDAIRSNHLPQSLMCAAEILMRRGLSVDFPHYCSFGGIHHRFFFFRQVSAIDTHGDLMRMAIASPGNDFRLGACEAPPAIVSTYLGDDMTSYLEDFMFFGFYGKHHSFDFRYP